MHCIIYASDEPLKKPSLHVGVWRKFVSAQVCEGLSLPMLRISHYMPVNAHLLHKGMYTMCSVYCMFVVGMRVLGKINVTYKDIMCPNLAASSSYLCPILVWNCTVCKNVQLPTPYSYSQ